VRALLICSYSGSACVAPHRCAATAAVSRGTGWRRCLTHACSAEPTACSVQLTLQHAACGLQRSMRLKNKQNKHNAACNVATARRCLRMRAERCGALRWTLRIARTSSSQASKQSNHPTSKAGPAPTERAANACHCCTCCKTARRPVTTTTGSVRTLRARLCRSTVEGLVGFRQRCIARCALAVAGCRRRCIQDAWHDCCCMLRVACCALHGVICCALQAASSDWRRC
jgi:hypothetical protein